MVYGEGALRHGLSAGLAVEFGGSRDGTCSNPGAIPSATGFKWECSCGTCGLTSCVLGTGCFETTWKWLAVT